MSEILAQSYGVVSTTQVYYSTGFFGRDSVGQNLHCWQEGSNAHNPYAVTAVEQSVIVGGVLHATPSVC